MNSGQVLIECPNTIFQILVHNEHELTKLEIFMGNIKTVKHLSIKDIYNWCNRQGFSYRTRFNYRKEFSLWKNQNELVRISVYSFHFFVSISLYFGIIYLPPADPIPS